jgi:hypothetical protein
MSDTNGWAEYKRQVLFQLEELNKVAKELNDKIDSLKEDVIILKVKAGFYGAVGGVVVSIIISLIMHLLTRKVAP